MKKTLDTLEAAAQILADLQPINEDTKGEIEQFRGEIRGLLELCRLDSNSAIQININRIADRVNDIVVRTEEENIYS